MREAAQKWRTRGLIGRSRNLLAAAALDARAAMAPGEFK